MSVAAAGPACGGGGVSESVAVMPRSDTISVHAAPSQYRYS